MAALATVDGVASSLCSDDVEWGIRIATSANRAPTAPTTSRCHVILRADACAMRARPEPRPEYADPVCAVSAILKLCINANVEPNRRPNRARRAMRTER